MRAQMKGGAKKKAKAKPKPEAVAAAPEAAAAELAPAPVPAPAAEGAPSVHVVQAGETVFRIARQYGVSVQQIRKWNNLKNDMIEVGQQLVVAQP
jgi:LysM repeat protein